MKLGSLHYSRSSGEGFVRMRQDWHHEKMSAVEIDMLDDWIHELLKLRTLVSEQSQRRQLAAMKARQT